MRKKELVELSITGILVMVMIFALGGNAAKRSRSRNLKEVLPDAGNLTAAPLAQAGKKTSSKDLYDFLEKQSELIELKRDPFTIAPIIMEKDAPREVVLTGILWDKDNPLAIIANNVVKEGQRVGNKTVMEIKQDRVILSDGEALFEVKLKN